MWGFRVILPSLFLLTGTSRSTEILGGWWCASGYHIFCLAFSILADLSEIQPFKSVSNIFRCQHLPLSMFPSLLVIFRFCISRDHFFTHEYSILPPPVREDATRLRFTISDTQLCYWQLSAPEVALFLNKNIGGPSTFETRNCDYTAQKILAKVLLARWFLSISHNTDRLIRHLLITGWRFWR